MSNEYECSKCKKAKIIDLCPNCHYKLYTCSKWNALFEEYTNYEDDCKYYEDT